MIVFITMLYYIAHAMILFTKNCLLAYMLHRLTHREYHSWSCILVNIYCEDL